MTNEKQRDADELIRALGLLALAQERAADATELSRLSTFVDAKARSVSGDWRLAADL